MADSDPKLLLRDQMSPKCVINLGMAQWSSLGETVWIRRSFEEFISYSTKDFVSLTCVRSSRLSLGMFRSSTARIMQSVLSEHMFALY